MDKNLAQVLFPFFEAFSVVLSKAKKQDKSEFSNYSICENLFCQIFENKNILCSVLTLGLYAIFCCDEEITPDNFSFDKFQESFNKRFELIKHVLACYNSNIGIEIAKAIEEAK